MASIPSAANGQALLGLAVLGGSQAVKICTQLASVVVLSRLLSPDDFGLAASVAPLVAFMAIFQDFGLQQAIIQRAEITQADLTSIFWMMLALGVCLTVVMAALGPLVAWFYDDPRMAWVTVAAAAPLGIYAVASVPTALLNRNGRFHVLAVSEILTACSGLGTAVIAALLGAGYWALVASPVAAASVTAGFVALRARWRPSRPVFAWPERGLLQFGQNLTGFTVVNFLGRNADNMLIGHAWGGLQLGYYDRAYKLILLPLQTINWPAQRVMLPLMSRIEADKPRLRLVYLRAVTQLVLLTVPGMATLAATAGSVVSLVFGERWAPVAPIFFWLGLVGLTQPLTNTHGWLFLCQARTQSLFRLGMIQAGVTILAFLAGLPWGALGVAIAYTASEFLVRAPLGTWWTARLGPVRLADFAAIQVPLLASAAVTWLFAHRAAGGMVGVRLILATAAVSYGSAIAALACVPGNRATLLAGLETVAGAVRARTGAMRLRRS